MESVDLADARSIDRGDASAGRRRRVIVGVVALGAVVVAGAVVFRWWSSGGARRSVKHLAEEGAVALADALVDQLLPAA